MHEKNNVPNSAIQYWITFPLIQIQKIWLTYSPKTQSLCLQFLTYEAHFIQLPNLVYVLWLYQISRASFQCNKKIAHNFDMDTFRR